MRSNNNDVAVVDAMDCGSGGGGSAQLWPDRYGGGVIGGGRADRAAAAESARRWRGSGAGAVGRCGRGILARRDDDRGVGDGGSGAVWEASAGDDQTESFDLLTA
jgi:hypothetical protein